MRVLKSQKLEGQNGEFTEKNNSVRGAPKAETERFHGIWKLRVHCPFCWVKSVSLCRCE